MANDKSKRAAAALRLIKANVHLVRGLAGATSEGYRAFFEAVNSENLLRRDLDNGLLRGAIAGWAVALENGAQLAEEALRIWLPDLLQDEEEEDKRDY